jgi:hypothetical protein
VRLRSCPAQCVAGVPDSRDRNHRLKCNALQSLCHWHAQALQAGWLASCYIFMGRFGVQISHAQA